MGAGLSTANANLAAAAAVGTNAGFVGLATGDPGAAGTTNPSSTPTREAVTWGSASGGAVSASNTPAWPAWAGTNAEVVSWLVFFSAATAGTFGMSMQLTASVTMNTGDTLSLTSLSLTISPIAS